MANVAASRVSERGKVTKYLYHRTNVGVTDPNYVKTSEESDLVPSPTGEPIDGLTSAELSNFFNADFWTYNNQVMTYNPLTDRYDIKSGEYVL